MVGNRFWGWVIYQLFFKNWKPFFSRTREKLRRKRQLQQARLKKAMKIKIKPEPKFWKPTPGQESTIRILPSNYYSDFPLYILKDNVKRFECRKGKCPICDLLEEKRLQISHPRWERPIIWLVRQKWFQVITEEHFTDAIKWLFEKIRKEENNHG
jgi:hypothetical protein